MSYIPVWESYPCAHCKRSYQQHANDKCLFESTMFEEMSLEQYRDVMLEEALRSSLPNANGEVIAMMKQFSTEHLSAKDIHQYMTRYFNGPSNTGRGTYSMETALARQR